MTLARVRTLASMVMLAMLTMSSLSFAAESKSTAADAEFIEMDTNKDGKG